MTMAPPPPSITAISTDGSLLAVHTPSTTLISTSTKKRLVIRCYDASLSYGAVRFTLSTNMDTTKGGGEQNENDASLSSSLVKQLLFISSSSKEAPPSHLCAMTSQNQILVWDLNRGVLIHTIEPFLPKDGKRMTLHSIASSSSSKEEEEEGGASLYALITRKDKVIMYEYSIEHGKLVRKIKSGSLEDDDDDDDEDAMGKKATYLGVAVGTSSLTHNTIYAVRHADHIRLMDHVGNKLKKLSLSLDDDEEEEGDKRGHGANSGNTPVIVQFSHDGKLLIASYSSTSLVLFNVEKEKQCGIIQLSDTQHSDISTFIQNVDILLDTTTTKMKSETDNDDDDDDEAYTVVLTSSNGIAQLYQTTLSTLKKKKKKKKKNKTQIVSTTICTFKSSSEWMNIGRIHFHSVKSDTKLVVTLVPHGSVASSSSSSKGGASTSTIAVREHSYRTTTDDDYKIIKGDVIIHVLSEEEKEKDAKKKRKLQDTTTTTSSSVVVLGPGDAGGEALGASDIMAVQQQKKIKMTDTKKDDDDDDDDDEFRLPYDDDDDDDEGEGKESIGERLKQLSSALDDPTDSEDDDDDDDDDEPKSSALTTKSRSSRAPATSESIATLLTQALLSNDDAQLEVALHVPDVRIINASLKALKGHPYKQEEEKNKQHSQQQSRAEFEYHQKGEILAALLAKLVTRLARAPSRAQNLGGWLRGTLVALKEHNEQSSGSGSGMKKGGGGGGNEIDLASKLAPLKNLLNDRVESFPHLLRLEGRLSLLGNRG